MSSDVDQLKNEVRILTGTVHALEMILAYQLATGKLPHPSEFATVCGLGTANGLDVEDLGCLHTFQQIADLVRTLEARQPPR